MIVRKGCKEGPGSGREESVTKSRNERRGWGNASV